MRSSAQELATLIPFIKDGLYRLYRGGILLVPLARHQYLCVMRSLVVFVPLFSIAR